MLQLASRTGLLSCLPPCPSSPGAPRTFNLKVASEKNLPAQSSPSDANVENSLTERTHGSQSPSLGGVSFAKHMLSNEAAANGDLSGSIATTKGLRRTVLQRYVNAKRFIKLSAMAKHIRPKPQVLSDLMLGLRLATLAYTDDHNPQDLVGIGLAAGGCKIAANHDWKLTPLLEDVFGLHLDEWFDLCGGVATGYIAHSDFDLVVAFRGTDSASDYLASFGIARTIFDPKRDQVGLKPSWSCQGCLSNEPRVHAGFYNAFLQAIPKLQFNVLPKLDQYTPSKRLIVVGHSLGGALAALALAYLLTVHDFKRSPHSILFVTAGQPRVGDSRFCEIVGKQINHLEISSRMLAVRLVNQRDCVPHMPGEFMGYHHMTQMGFLTSSGEIIFHARDEVAKDDILISDSSGTFSSAFSDHVPEAYLDTLEKAINSMRA